jgi:thiamine kinase-like enzyme
LDDAALAPVFAALPQLQSAPDLSVEPIPGGITNRNYLVTARGERYFARLSDPATATLGIDRVVEAAANEAGARAGIAPEVVAARPHDGCLVLRYVQGRPIGLEEMREPATLGRVVASIRAFHRLPEIPGSFSPFRVVEDYLEEASARGVPDPASYSGLIERAHSIREAFARNPVALRPCHNDLLNANFILEGERVVIVDYEYAGMGDFFFDLGNLSVNNGFDDDADEALLELYFGEVTPPRRARLKLMRIMSDFREAMWGHLQGALSSLDFDYEGYAQEHFDRCELQARDPRYEGWLRDAAGAA